MTRYKRTPKPASPPARRSGGLSHVLYDHRWRPRVLDVRCPRCGALARATKPSEAEAGAVVAESESWAQSDWALVCTGCPSRPTGLAFDELPDLFWRIDAGATTLWAWNRGHLELLLKVLRSEPTNDDPYHLLSQYVPREWLRRRRALEKAVRRALEAPDPPAP